MADTKHGHQIDLSDGRHVFVAKDDGQFWIRFCNAEGEITRLRLSHDAGDALQYLLGDHQADVLPGTIRKFLLHIVHAEIKGEPTIEWRSAPLDTASPPAEEPTR